MILSIDTSLGTSVAIADLDGSILALHDTFDTMRHAEVMGEALESTFDAAGVAPRAISCVVAGVGPGPFTGLRVGLAAATAFAVARGVEIHPAVSHDAIALAHFSTQPAEMVRVVTDARRREVYVSEYSGLSGGLPVRVAGPALAKPDDLDQMRSIHADFVSATDLALVALAERRVGLTRAFEPLYLRSPDVTMSAGPKRVNP